MPSKQEVISLYRSWEDVHNNVTEVDGEYLKLSYIEAAHKSISDLLTHNEVKGKHRKKAGGSINYQSSISSLSLSSSL
jgi:hypothetical protein